jgi:hypothetical protein
MTKLEQIALAIFNKVTEGQGETRWEEMSPEERQDSLEWARAGLEAAREPSKLVLDRGITAIEDAEDRTQDSNEVYLITGASDYALPCWQAMLDAILTEGRGE